MVEVENRQWETAEHSLFAMQYTGQIIVHSFSGEGFSEADQTLAAAHLSDSGDNLRTILIDTDNYLSRFILTLRMEAEGDRAALQHLCSSAIEAWASTGKDITDLEFVEAHLVYEPELDEDIKNDATISISSKRYTIDELELPDLDDFGIPIRVEAHEIFYKARDQTVDS